MPQGRVQAPDLHTEQLRTIAYSGDTFVQAPRPQEDTRADQFIQALGHFNQNLTQMGANMAAGRQKEQAEEIQRQKNLSMAATPEGRSEIARTGILPDGTKIEDGQVLTMAGLNAGTASQENIQKTFAGRDLTGVDTDAEIDKLVAPELKEYRGNTWVLGAISARSTRRKPGRETFGPSRRSPPGNKPWRERLSSSYRTRWTPGRSLGPLLTP